MLISEKHFVFPTNCRTFALDIKYKEMKKIKIGMLALASLVMVSCGNMGQVMSAMTNGTGLGNAIKSVIGLDKVKAQQLIGDWKYKGPGCAFTSENLLAKAGGEIAAVQIEEKVQPYYQQAGLSAENTFISFKEDGTFSSRIAGTPFSGQYTFDEETQKITLKNLFLSVNCYAKKEVGGISILFEAKKLLTFLQTVSAFSDNKDLQTISDLSKKYDGVRIGFDLNK